jgi:hypothetical protein
MSNEEDDNETSFVYYSTIISKTNIHSVEQSGTHGRACIRFADFYDVLERISRRTG